MICNKQNYFIVEGNDSSINPAKQPGEMQKKILIIDDHDDLETLLTDEFGKRGHIIKSTEDRDEAIDLLESEKFDLIVTDLDGENLQSSKTGNADSVDCLPEEIDFSPRSSVKAFKICISNYKNEDFTEDELKYFVETVLNLKARAVDKKAAIQELHEKIEFEVPSYVSLMHDILNYLMKRVEKSGVVNPETSNLFVALDEAFVNAVKHGNKFNAEKLVRITAEVSKEEARFTIEDEGDGFDVNSIPDPRNPENLFKTSGRGVLFIHNIMDEVTYNDRGNRLTMIKKSDKREITN